MQEDMIDVICPAKPLFHCLTHFHELDPAARKFLVKSGFEESHIDAQMAKPGSKFYPEFATSVDEIVRKMAEERPDLFAEGTVPCDSEMKAYLSVEFPYPIGTRGVALLAELSEDQLATMTVESRNGLTVRKAYVDKAGETSECQLIMRKDGRSWRLLTVYPGEFAPPLPRHGEPDPYWDVHCFIEER